MSEATAEPIGEGPSPGADGDPARILIIDDEPIIQDVLRHILGSEAHELHVVPDAETGIKALG